MREVRECARDGAAGGGIAFRPRLDVDRVDHEGVGFPVDAGIDAVGMEGSGSAVDTVLQRTKLQPDRLSALLTCLGAIRRGGTLSITGVYTAWVPFVPLGAVMDRQLTMRVG